MIKIESPVNIRQIILCATLSERPVEIINYRNFEQPQGLKPYEAKFFQLIEKISNGSKFEINKTGTLIKYYPGIITNNNGIPFEFNCGAQRSITYFLEYLSQFVLFGKSNISVKLFGVTNDNIDQSVDSFLNICIPLIKRFNDEINISLKIIKRGFQHDATGEISFMCNQVKFLKAVQLDKKGYIKRIRGTCAGALISPHIINQIIAKVREILNEYTTDVWVYSDFSKKSKGGQQMGYSISLVAETDNGNFIGIDEAVDTHSEKQEQINFEKFAEKASLYLLDEIFYSGVIDTINQSMLLNLMSMSERNISSAKLGRISPYTIDNLRIIRDFFGVTFKIIPDETQEDDIDDESMEEEQQEQTELQMNQNSQNNGNKLDKICLTKWQCFGSGLQNMSRITF